MVNIIRLTGLASAAVALGACGSKVPEADQRAAIIQGLVDTCVRGFEQRKTQMPGVTPAGLESRRFCECGVAKLAEGKDAEQLHALETDPALPRIEGQVVSTCLNEEARRAGVIEPDMPAPADRGGGRTGAGRTEEASATPPPPRAGRTPTRPAATDPRRPETAPRPRSSDPIATPVAPPRVPPSVPPGFSPSPARPATPTSPPAPPRTPGSPTSLLPRTPPPPSAPRPATPRPAPRPSQTRPPPEG